MCLRDVMQIDTASGVQTDSKTEAFVERLVGVLNDAATATMLSIGHRTRLFDVMATLPPATSAAIAEAAELNERYVREWLAAMVTSRVVEYSAADGTYRLPPEHAAALTRAAAPNNLAASMQMVTMLGAVEERIVRCFREGGGVPYEDFHRFHEVMAEESDQTVCAALVDAILPLGDGVIAALERGIDVLDVGCGSGHALCVMAARFPNSRFVGYDLCEDAVAAGRAVAAREWLPNVRFEVKDVTAMDEPERYDLITAFDAIHDQAHPGEVLRNIARALKPDGTFLMQDIAGSSHLEKNMEHPVATFLYTISCNHCMTVSLAYGGDGLGTMWGQEKAEQMLREAGFREVQVHTLEHDIMNVFYVVRHA